MESGCAVKMSTAQTPPPHMSVSNIKMTVFIFRNTAYYTRRAVAPSTENRVPCLTYHYTFNR